MFNFLEKCEMELDGSWHPCRVLVPLGSGVPGIVFVLLRTTDNMRCILYETGEYVERTAAAVPAQVALV